MPIQNHLRSSSALAAAFVFMTAAPEIAAAQNTQSVFCLTNGTAVSVSRFEAANGLFILYPTDGSAPQRVPSAQVQQINGDCSGRVVAATKPIGADMGSRIDFAGTVSLERVLPPLIEAYAQARYQTKPQEKYGAVGLEKVMMRDQRNSAKADITVTAGLSDKNLHAGLVDGRHNVIMSLDRLSDQTIATIRSRYGIDATTKDSEHVIALDGVVFNVHPQNPVSQLTTAQIGQIFAGKITNWNQLGGPNLPITLVRRGMDSDSVIRFSETVLTPAGLKLAPVAKEYSNFDAITDTVMQQPGAIGIIGFPYIAKSKPIGITTACGIIARPSRFAIKTEQYPFTRRVYLYTIGTPRDSVLADLVDFATSADAQAPINEAGYVDQAMEMQRTTEQQEQALLIAATAEPGVPRNAVERYLRQTMKAQRTSITFHFPLGVNRPDTRGAQDIRHLQELVRRDPSKAAQIQVLGFADSTGGYGSNERLAQERANSVADELRKNGIDIPQDRVLSFSSLAPVACNDTQEGRGMNRRVEIWIGQPGNNN